MRNTCGWPTRPPAMVSRTFRKLGSKRRLKPTIMRMPRRATSSLIACTFAMERSIGFSQKICFPRGVDRLLAKDLFSARGRIHDHLVVLVGRGADDYRVH